MDIILKLNLDDINTNKIGLNFQIITGSGVTIIFSDEAIKELISDYQKDNK